MPHVKEPGKNCGYSHRAKGEREEQCPSDQIKERCDRTTDDQTGVRH